MLGWFFGDEKIPMPIDENKERTKRQRSTKRQMALRDARMIRALAAGQALEEVAAREEMSLRRARERVSAILARGPDPTAEFAAMQTRRLNEAMLVAYGAMRDGNLKAVDRVIRITREYDRYHALATGLGAAPAAIPAPPAPLALAPPPALETPHGDEIMLSEVASA